MLGVLQRQHLSAFDLKGETESNKYKLSMSPFTYIKKKQKMLTELNVECMKHISLCLNTQSQITRESVHQTVIPRYQCLHSVSFLVFRRNRYIPSFHFAFWNGNARCVSKERNEGYDVSSPFSQWRSWPGSFLCFSVLSFTLFLSYLSLLVFDDFSVPSACTVKSSQTGQKFGPASNWLNL